MSSPPTLSIVIPCFNESATIERCLDRVLAIASESLALEIVIVDDASSDDSLAKARALAQIHAEISVVAHDANRGKGAALRTGFRHVTGDFVAVQDADLEYDPRDLVSLLEPLVADEADAVLGSRFLSVGRHRVHSFWHFVGNKVLTLTSNFFTDLHLTDMETCYKVFRRDLIQSIEIEEDRFGFEPEIVAKLAERRVRIHEMGISYQGRAYSEGKKIGAPDGFRALYCIVRYNAPSAPVGILFAVHLLAGAVVVSVATAAFVAMHGMGAPLSGATVASFVLAALVNYGIHLKTIFRRNARWSEPILSVVYAALMLVVGGLDLATASALVDGGTSPVEARALAAVLLFAISFAAFRSVIAPKTRTEPWTPTRSGRAG